MDPPLRNLREHLNHAHYQFLDEFGLLGAHSDHLVVRDDRLGNVVFTVQPSLADQSRKCPEDRVGDVPIHVQLPSLHSVSRSGE